jgi:NitT/TauT family transport system substrate-binding protein
MRLSLYENHRFVLYAPFYAAHATGAYSTEGLTVELSRSPGMGLAEQALLYGAVDVLWVGPMRVMRHHDENPGSPLVCFAEIVCRDPFSIIGRYPKPDFRPTDLAYARFATVSEVPTPWLCLQHDLRQAGVNPARLNRVSDRNMPDNLSALREGQLDAAQLFEPFVEEALASNIGHLWYAADSRGRTTYTAFITTRQRLKTDPEPLLRMVRAIFQSQRWIYMEPSQAIAAAVGSFFPALDRYVLAHAIDRYKAHLVWGSDPVLPEDGFNRLQGCLLSSGFIRRPASYEECVDNTLAREVIAGRMDCSAM